MDKEFILSSPKGRATERYIRKNYPDEYKNILSCFGEKFTEKLYNYLNNSPSHICPICGKLTPFRNILYGYSQFCSVKCSYSSEERLNKIKQTCIERYGVENPSQSDSIKKKKEETCLKNYGVTSGFKLKDKFKQTCIERYGVENPSQSDSIKKKKEETCLKNYGVTSALKLENTRKLSKQKLLEKYGVEYAFDSKDIRDKAIQKHRESFVGTHELHIGYTENGNWICKCPHPECDKCNEKWFEIHHVMFRDRQKNKSEICTRLLPIGIYNQGTTIELYIRNILDEYKVPYLSNDRSILNPKELDIYIPSKNIAIECNGVYWHSLKASNYHTNKFVNCKNKNIQLITIWEDWVHRKPEIVKSLILSKLGIYEHRMYARKCIIKEVNSKLCNDFLETNHIQGRSQGSVRLGLYYNNELVSIMTFNKSRIGIGVNEEGYELVRFCNKLNTQIIGGASKLFKYFINNYNPSQVVSYSSNDISIGDLYEILGFKTDHKINNAYWYIHKDTFIRYHRFNFRKSKLKDMGYDVECNTESQIMNELPYYKIYDSGTIRWVYMPKN